MPKISSEKTEGIQSVVLALTILETLGRAGSHLGVTALADALGTTKSRIHRHLQTLVQQGYIVQSPLTERYRLGSRLIELGNAAANASDVASVAAQPMRALRDVSDQAVILGQIEDEGIRILTTLPGKMSVEVGVRPGSTLRFNTSAQGKMALAFMPEANRERILAEPLIGETSYSITDLKVLRKHLDDIRSRGWADAPNEAAMGLNALSFPLLGAGGELMGSLAIVSLTQFIGSPPSPDQIRAVGTAAGDISKALGYMGELPGNWH
ncbi:IclR family transcriptional regulator [Notoacmeibacter sp. MSK16QG-6]|uniref:IclR family transcriptional regulator n=1 Tax=Notoacmeibacter sp. MSK16QG-6 TaxID=2957982 RepID=UPI0020A1A9C8|nr:IclR family transcriptional regulator [Notoacmeibacter sp. MSK16QG-6]MCP1198314.1 IclR family transcriptional regulator [Notoacmeibacter sp. MSK16QG-6]